MDSKRLRQLVDDERYVEAETAAAERFAAGDRAPATLAVLAAAARRLGHFDTAATALREAAAQRPDDPAAWLELAEILSLGARWVEALRAFRLAAELAPHDPVPLFGLGRAQLVSRDTVGAGHTASLLLKQFPDAAESHVFLAHLERTLGRTQEAVAAYRNALRLDTACAPALLGLAELAAHAHATPLLERVAQALESEERTAEQRIQLEFAAARLLDRASRIDEAFEHLSTANELHRKALAAQGIHCSRERMNAWLDTARHRYPRASSASPARQQSSDHGILPVFIVGMPRSGTTLIEQILARHSAVAAGGEFTAAATVHADYLRARSSAGLPWPVDPGSATESRLLADARERYVERALALAGGSRFFVDKHPGNAALVGFLRLLFPAAPVIHATRSAPATCWSIYAAYLPGSSACFTALEDIAHYHAAHDALMRHWTATCDPPVLELRYERLVSEPEPVIRSLLTACGLEWQEECLAPHAGRLAVTTASVDQVRSPIHRGSIDRHLRYERHLGPLRTALETSARSMSSPG
jgi:cytochrome c-type biogenesis protein CcmH/NrfG